jgi:hypothetical protein
MRSAFRPCDWYAVGVRARSQLTRLSLFKLNASAAANGLKLWLECCDRRREKLNFYERLFAIELILDAKSTVLGVLSVHQGEPEYI